MACVHSDGSDPGGEGSLMQERRGRGILEKGTMEREWGGRRGRVSPGEEQGQLSSWRGRFSPGEEQGQLSSSSRRMEADAYQLIWS